MSKSTVALGAALSLAFTGGAAAQPAAAPQAARWHLDGSTTRCVLTRRLEGTPAPATFVLRTVPGSGRYDLMLAGPGLPGEIRRGNRRLQVSLAPGGVAHQRRSAAVDLDNSLGDAVALPSLPASLAAEFAGASSVALADEAGRPIASWTIPLAARAAEALAACEAEKQVDWGADPAGLEPGATPPRAVGDPDEWLTARALGMADILASVAVAAVFRLVVGADGRVADCTILESGGNVELNRQACRTLARRARYQPARDPRGAPVRSVVIYSIEARSDLEVRIVP